MSEYALRFSSSAEKELDALDNPLFRRIDNKIVALGPERQDQTARYERSGKILGHSLG